MGIFSRAKLTPKGTAEQVKQMKAVREAVERAVLPFRENTEAAVIAGACAQVAKLLIQQYPQKAEAELLAGMVGFFRGANPAGEEQDSPIIIPSRSRRTH
jgi:hypothetical protein